MMQYIYSPAEEFSSLAIFFELVSTRAILVGLALVLVRGGMKKCKCSDRKVVVFISCIAVLLVGFSIFNIKNQYYKVKNESLNYQDHFNYKNINHLSGVIESVAVKEEAWVGNVFESKKPDFKWKVYYISLSSGIVKFRDLNWERNRRHDMPICYKGDFYKLFNVPQRDTLFISTYSGWADEQEMLKLTFLFFS
ncbi:hypothetical protein [Enterovibrio norvegicus]|uniref:hypothetical protein n=1 Tax=Enterovibrio norvegicus TaxID=188144 RepID=UPI00352DA6AD